MNISSNLINISLQLSLKHKGIQNLTDILHYANWVQNKGPLYMFCLAPGAFIRRNTVLVIVKYLTKVKPSDWPRYFFHIQSDYLSWNSNLKAYKDGKIR